MQAVSSTTEHDSLVKVLRGYTQSSLSAAPVQFSWKTLRRFVLVLLTQRRLITSGVLAMIVCVAATLCGPWLLGRLVDSGIVAKNYNAVVWITGAYLLAEGIRIGSSMLQAYSIGSAGEWVMHDLRVAICARSIQLPAARLDTTPSGSLLARATSDVVALSSMFSAGVLNIVEKLVVVCSIVFTMFLLDPKLAAVALAPFVPILAISIFISFGLHRAHSKCRRTIGWMTSFLVDSVNGLRVIRVFGGSDVQTGRFRWLSKEIARAQLRPAVLSGSLHPAMTIVTAASMGLIACYGAPMVRSGEIKVGLLVTFFSYILWIFWPIMHAISQWNIVVAGIAAADRIFELLDWDPEEDRSELQANPVAEVQGEIEFRGVWFSYSNDEQWALRDVSFTLRPGSMAGIVGATGSGKSTIISLLLRLYEPQRGEIFLDGVPIVRWPKRTLRDLFGVVRQDLVTFNGTIAENIALFSKTAPELPSGLNEELTRRGLALSDNIGERGRALSMGERQLISFCRAFARSPRIWILDEATAHLDPWLDRELDALLRKYAPDKTVICVAHRLSSVVHADPILVIQDGEVRESGAHQHLVALGGLYSRYYEIQSQMQQGVGS